MITTVNTAILTAQRILECSEHDTKMAKLIQESDLVFLKRISAFDRQNIVRTYGIALFWRKIGRQVLAMHPEVVQEVRVATSDKVPVEILRVLPYQNPMIVFSEPPIFGTWLHPEEHFPGDSERRGVSMRLLGFYCAGGAIHIVIEDGKQIREQHIYSTTDLLANQFIISLIFEVVDSIGRTITYETNTFTIDFSGFVGTLGELVDGIIDKFHWASNESIIEYYAPEIDAHHRKWVRSVMGVVIGSLFYLCSTTLEAEKVPFKRVARRLPKQLTRIPFSLYKVGWTTGAALTRLRQIRTASTSEQSDIAHQQDPQHRRAHFKMQPYGPGGSLRKLIFVSAYWTHLERLGEAGVNTVRKVPRLEGKGSARESLGVALSTGMAPVEVQH